tara:strand:+ start:2138 stop:2671 length:534 start_codon:yes stop_codon:yes gene_type:complete
MVKNSKKTEDTSSSRFVLAGKLYYGYLHPEFPDTAYTPRWGLALSLEEDMQELALNNSMTVKDPTAIMDNPFVSLHKNVRNAKGEENKAPLVVDAKKRIISDDILGSIGWGSDVKVLVSRFFMSKWNKWGFSIDKIQIINLIEYDGGSDGFDEEDGFEAPSAEVSGSNVDIDDDLPF